MKHFRHVVIYLFLLLCCTCFTGCEDDDIWEPIWEPYYKSIAINNETDKSIVVHYPSGIDEADWVWEDDEYEYEYREIEPYQHEFIRMLITDFDEVDILTFEMGDYKSEIVGTWREADAIGVDFDNDSEELVFTYHR